MALVVAALAGGGIKSAPHGSFETGFHGIHLEIGIPASVITGTLSGFISTGLAHLKSFMVLSKENRHEYKQEKANLTPDFIHTVCNKVFLATFFRNYSVNRLHRQ